MQVIFDSAIRLKENVDISIVSVLTGFSRKTVRIAFEKGRRKVNEQMKEVEHTAEGGKKNEGNLPVSRNIERR
jgi:hypothetical protein